MTIYVLVGKALVQEVVKDCELDECIRTSVWDYMDDTSKGCARDPSYAEGRNLITYGVEKIASESPDGKLSGARILDRLIRKLHLSRWHKRTASSPAWRGFLSVDSVAVGCVRKPSRRSQNYAWTHLWTSTLKVVILSNVYAHYFKMAGRPRTEEQQQCICYSSKVNHADLKNPENVKQNLIETMGKVLLETLSYDPAAVKLRVEKEIEPSQVVSNERKERSFFRRRMLHDYHNHSRRFTAAALSLCVTVCEAFNPHYGGTPKTVVQIARHPLAGAEPGPRGSAHWLFPQSAAQKEQVNNTAWWLFLSMSSSYRASYRKIATTELCPRSYSLGAQQRHILTSIVHGDRRSCSMLGRRWCCALVLLLLGAVTPRTAGRPELSLVFKEPPS
ncbi:hypothetical protein ACP4OV_009945 [Aristida adscensionis]